MKFQETNGRLADDLGMLIQDAEALLSARTAWTVEQVETLRCRPGKAPSSARGNHGRLCKQALAVANTTHRVSRARPYESFRLSLAGGVLMRLLLAQR